MITFNVTPNAQYTLHPPRAEAWITLKTLIRIYKVRYGFLQCQCKSNNKSELKNDTHTFSFDTIRSSLLKMLLNLMSIDSLRENFCEFFGIFRDIVKEKDGESEIKGKKCNCLFFVVSVRHPQLENLLFSCIDIAFYFTYFSSLFRCILAIKWTLAIC